MNNPDATNALFSRLHCLLKRLKAAGQSQDLNSLTYVVLDTETTGFDYDTDRILSIGAIRLHGQQIRVQDCLEIYVKQQHYNKESTAIHGILSREQRPCLEEVEALRQLTEYLGDDVVVGHHTKFDITMLNNALKRHGMPRIRNKVLDTSTLYRKSLIKSPVVARKDHYTLDELADKFDISKKDRHTALGDAYITAIAFQKILVALRKKGVTTWREIMRRD